MPAERLRSQLAALHFPLDSPTRTGVQRCVCEYVDAMKADHWPPERMLVGLKRIAAESGLTSSSLPARESRASRAELLMDMVAWSIERYYDPAAREAL
ncbi:MAG: hypothetical protein ACHQWU_06895 [Gemmatimonadales bacterium]